MNVKPRRPLTSGEDHFIIEVVDPKTVNRSIWKRRELVVAPLTRKAMPLIRYRTSDIVKMLDVQSCNCGRTHRKISWIEGRVDDMIKVRGNSTLQPWKQL